jgi:hypothetical protein
LSKVIIIVSIVNMAGGVSPYQITSKTIYKKDAKFNPRSEKSEKPYQTASPTCGFPQTLQTPFSLMVPMQFPSRQGMRSEKSVSAFSIFMGFPHRQQ